jgi:hypothetical protein
MDYHARKRIEDGVLRMPADGYAFKEIVAKWPGITDEPHNVRLSLATDGVNPFGQLQSVYLVWPIFLLSKITFLLGCQ